tara:strand:+ start:382 stop:717 length:336 start_codon:yes stop_codon:yes gene_type:complete
MDNLNNKKEDKNEMRIEKNNSKADENKNPLSYLTGSATSFALCIFLFLLSKKIAFYFATHRPTNTSEIVQSISTSLNTLIIGLSFLATFSFAFIGLGLFIVFIRSFFIKNS